MAMEKGATGYPLKQFAQSSANTWREEIVTISGNATKTVTFLDTRPNMFYILNNNSTTLRVGIGSIPTANKYEFNISANGPTVFGRPTATQQLHIYNPSSGEVSISLFSLAGSFDLNILNKTSVSMGNITVEPNMNITGFSDGVSLPYGTNNIGNVGIEGSIPAGSNVIGKVSLTGGIPAGTNTIGKVRIDGTLPAGSNKIGSVGVDGDVSVSGFADWAATVTEKLNSLIAKEAGGPAAVTDICYYSGKDSSTTTEIDFVTEGVQPNYILYLANDGDTDLGVRWYIGSNATYKEFVLKKGDYMFDIPVTLNAMTIYPHSSGTAVSWRFLGGVR